MGEPRLQPSRRRFTIRVEAVGDSAWHLTVDELPRTWTVAFTADELERRARERIALDEGLDPDEFDIEIATLPDLFIERRANRRDRP